MADAEPWHLSRILEVTGAQVQKINGEYVTLSCRGELINAQMDVAMIFDESTAARIQEECAGAHTRGETQEMLRKLLDEELRFICHKRRTIQRDTIDGVSGVRRVLRDLKMQGGASVLVGACEEYLELAGKVLRGIDEHPAIQHYCKYTEAVREHNAVYWGWDAANKQLQRAKQPDAVLCPCGRVMCKLTVRRETSRFVGMDFYRCDLADAEEGHVSFVLADQMQRCEFMQADVQSRAMDILEASVAEKRGDLDEWSHEMKAHKSYLKDGLDAGKRIQSEKMTDTLVQVEADLLRFKWEMTQRIRFVSQKASGKPKPVVDDPFTILGVERDATEETIRARYRKLVLEFHPDKHVNATESDSKAAADSFRRVQDAYEQIASVLSARHARHARVQKASAAAASSTTRLALPAPSASKRTRDGKEKEKRVSQSSIIRSALRRGD